MTTPRGFVEKVLERVAGALEAGTLDTLEADLLHAANEFVEAGTSVAPLNLAKAVDPEQRIAWGWANVSTVAGEPYFDHQNDYIAVDELRKAAHNAIRHRVSKAMHRGRQVGEIVESIVLDAPLQKALGIDLGQEGWFVGVHFTDDPTWRKVQSGEYQGFSLGGSGIRKEYVLKFKGDTSEDMSSCPHGSPMCKDCKAKMPKMTKSFADIVAERLAKFNPYHGSDGRFTGGGGGGRIGGARAWDAEKATFATARATAAKPHAGVASVGASDRKDLGSMGSAEYRQKQVHRAVEELHHFGMSPIPSNLRGEALHEAALYASSLVSSRRSAHEPGAYDSYKSGPFGAKHESTRKLIDRWQKELQSVIPKPAPTSARRPKKPHVNMYDMGEGQGLNKPRKG